MLPGLRAAVADSRVKAAATRRRRAAEAQPAEVDPVARVLVDVPLPHLDRPFDYAVPATMAETAVPGARVRVRFAGQDVDGFVLARAAGTTHPGRLQPLRRAVSAEPVLLPEIADLSEQVARRYAGARADVLRLAVPPRHARTEAQPSPPAPPLTAVHDPQVWAGHAAGPAFLAHLAAGGAPRAAWSSAPGADWPRQVAHAVLATAAGGRGALVCLPDHRDVARVDRALIAALGEGHHVVLTAEGGPAARYRDFLAVSRGARRIVVGTRSAAFAPVHDLGLVVLWDDGDDLHAEPRAPYPHVREVLLLRAAAQRTGLLLAGVARSTEAQLLVESGWVREIGVDRETLRASVRVDVVPGEDRSRGTRVPRAAHDAIRSGLAEGPVLVQTPRSGYVPALACERCRTPARCRVCAGPLQLAGATAPPRCRWCGTEESAWRCPECGHRGLRAPVLGDARTAEELGRSFPGTTVRSSSGDRVVATVGGRPDLVVATVGAEPVAEAGYSTVVLLDTWLTLARDDLRVVEEAARRWFNAAALVRRGGRVVAVGDPAHPALQALVRWDPAGLARRELDERRQVHLPPAARIATLTAEPGPLDDALTLLQLPPGAEVLGPVPHPPPGVARSASPTGSGAATGRAEEQQRVVVRVPRAEGAALSASLSELQRVRSARKLDPVRVRVDPHTL